MIGIFGGTFDPVHNGHLETIQYVRQSLNLEQVRLIPLGHAVHRQQPIASASQRIEMLNAATINLEGLVVDDREINRPGGSYTVDTLESLRRDFPGKSLCLIIGTDAFNGFETWKTPDKILSLSHLVVMQRPATDKDSIQTEFTKQLLKTRQAETGEELQLNDSGKILFVEVPQIDISSTMIRSKLSEHENINQLLPSAVEQLIRQWQLYQ